MQCMLSRSASESIKTWVEFLWMQLCCFGCPSLTVFSHKASRSGCGAVNYLPSTHNHALGPAHTLEKSCRENMLMYWEETWEASQDTRNASSSCLRARSERSSYSWACRMQSRISSHTCEAVEEKNEMCATHCLIWCVAYFVGTCKWCSRQVDKGGGDSSYRVCIECCCLMCNT